MRLLFKYPTRSRPALFQSTLTRYIDLLSGKHDARFVISCDEDDCSMATPEMRAWIAARPVPCEVFYNPPPQTKVSAINANLDGRTFDLACLCSDDMLPEATGYDDRMVTLLFGAFPDGDGVLHANDGRAGRRLNTQVIMGEAYYRRFGWLYNPAYKSLWCDDELHAVAEKLGKSHWVDEVLIRHHWTDATGVDDLHKRNESHFETDGWTFARRKLAGFPR